MHVGHQCRHTWGRTGSAFQGCQEEGKLFQSTIDQGYGHGGALWEVWKPTCTVLSSYQEEEWGSWVIWSPLSDLRKSTPILNLDLLSHDMTSEGYWCLTSQDFSERLPGKHMAWCPAPMYWSAAAGANTVPSAWQPQSTFDLHSCQDRQTKVCSQVLHWRL